MSAFQRRSRRCSPLATAGPVPEDESWAYELKLDGVARGRCRRRPWV
jgi:hypothetical protein